MGPGRRGFAKFVFGVRTGVSPGRHSYVTFLGVYSNGFRQGTACAGIHANGAVGVSTPATFVTRGGRVISRT